MEALTLTRDDYISGLQTVEQAAGSGSPYLSQFTVTFPDGLNTASVMEICRAMQDPEFETKVHIMRLCIAGKNVRVTCPDGSVESFCMSGVDDSLDAIPLFVKEPLAIVAISDNIYGYLLKKYLRPCKPKAEPVKATKA